MLAWMQRSGSDFDNSTQAISQSFIHGMRAVGQDPAEAVELTRFFIDAKLAEANQQARDGNCVGALAVFAQAMHPVMDRRSPAHRDRFFQPIEWAGKFSWGAPWHIPIFGAESYFDLTFEIKAALRTEMREYYGGTFPGCLCRSVFEKVR
jgi:hypothetical protein